MDLILQLLGFVAALCWALDPRLAVAVLRALIFLYAFGIGPQV